MIYSMGYQDKDIEFFVKALRDLGITILMDIRSRPTGWNPHYRFEYLKKRMGKEGIEYLWRGDTLGGFGEIKEEAIKALADWQAGRALCLMCMEADPMKCHRHLRVAARLKAYGVTVHHIIKDGDSVRIMEA